ncbi:MAG: CapA family protein [Treponema sp.]|nr:CapA family protein [Treponema sp.]
MVRYRRLVSALFSTALMLTLSACASTASRPSQPEALEKAHSPAVSEETLTLLFAGDIMAHKNNYAYPAFSRIWDDVAPLVQSADLAFANMEAPVADSLPWSSYPQFNMHSSYAEAAIQAGFDVFSLANNHTNDQSLSGMQETRRWFSTRKGIWACGIKEKAGGPLTWQLIEKDGWKILFVAFTQVLNSWDSVSYIDYVPSRGEKLEALFTELAALKAAYSPDLFVVSVHADEVEYKRTVWEKQRTIYQRLIADCGADVVWSNHAHVVKPWNIVPASEKAPHGAIIMYANGNTISGQRTSPSWDAPDTERDWTGDGLMMSVCFTRTGSTIQLTKAEPHFITTVLAVDGQPVIRLLDEDLAKSMRRAGRYSWESYLTERRRLLEAIQPLN